MSETIEQQKQRLMRSFVTSIKMKKTITEKAHSRPHCLRKLGSFVVRPHILQMFFCSAVVNILTYRCVCWGGNLTKKKKEEKNRPKKITRAGGRRVGRTQDSFNTLYKTTTTTTTTKTSSKKSDRHTSRRHKSAQGGIQQPIEYAQLPLGL